MKLHTFLLSKADRAKLKKRMQRLGLLRKHKHPKSFFASFKK